MRRLRAKLEVHSEEEVSRVRCHAVRGIVGIDNGTTDVHQLMNK